MPRTDITFLFFLITCSVSVLLGQFLESHNNAAILVTGILFVVLFTSFFLCCCKPFRLPVCRKTVNVHAE